MSDKKFIILWKDYLEGCGWVNRVCFTDSLNLDDIAEAIGAEEVEDFNDDAEMFEIKKVKKPLFPKQKRK